MRGKIRNATKECNVRPECKREKERKEKRKKDK